MRIATVLALTLLACFYTAQAIDVKVTHELQLVLEGIYFPLSWNAI